MRGGDSDMTVGAQGPPVPFSGPPTLAEPLVEMDKDTAMHTTCLCRYIGQKGIGFKSVFRVSDTPEIRSRGYCFRFDASHGAMGYVLPQWIDDPPAAEVPLPPFPTPATAVSFATNRGPFQRLTGAEGSAGRSECLPLSTPLNVPPPPPTVHGVFIRH